MPAAPASSRPVYLVERLDPNVGWATLCDVTLHLELALETLLELFQAEDLSPDIEVDIDEDGELAGVGFFDEDDDLLARITAYYLEHEPVDCLYPELVEAARAPLHELQARLERLF